MTTSYDAIAAKVQETINERESKSIAEGGWGAPKFTTSVPVYVPYQQGTDSNSPESNGLGVLGRYGNWGGQENGGGKYSQFLDFSALANIDCSTESGRKTYLLQLSDLKTEFEKNFKEGGIYYKPADLSVRDSYDAASRTHTLLYQEAETKAFDQISAKIQNFDITNKTASEIDSYFAEISQIEATQTREMREADVWFLKHDAALPDDPIGVLERNIQHVYLGMNADRYYLQNLPEIPVDKVLQGVFEQYGSRLGKLVAGDNWLAKQALSMGFKNLGGEFGKQVGLLFMDKSSGSAASAGSSGSDTKIDIKDSILQTISGDMPLSKGLDNALQYFGIETSAKAWGKLEAKGLSAISNLCIPALADQLELGGYWKFTFTSVGKDISSYFSDQITKNGGAGLSSDQFFQVLTKDINPIDVVDYMGDLLIKYVANNVMSDFLNEVKSVVTIENKLEGIFAEFTSLAGSFIGNELLPFLGGEIGSTIGYIAGALEYEFLNFISFGFFDKISDYIFGDPHKPPAGHMFDGVDPATSLLVVVNEDWRKGSLSSGQLQQLISAHGNINSAYIGYVNSVISEIGGKPDWSFFKPYSVNLSEWAPAIRPDIPILNHAVINHYQWHFTLTTWWGGQEQGISDGNGVTPSDLVQGAIAYELAHIDFIGGDLAQIRALRLWEAHLSDEVWAQNANKIILPPSPSPQQLIAALLGTGPVVQAGVPYDPVPHDPALEVLNANLHIAQEYRYYLDNAAIINMLITEAPDSPFTIGWLATLARANELGLNGAYNGGFDGGAGTSSADIIKSADGNDLLYGNGGNDTIYAYGGNDTVYGGEGADSIDGGTGDDLLGGDAGNDTIIGGNGADSLYGGTGDDSLNAGPGDDFVGGDAGNDTLLGGPGNDSLFGYSENDVIYGDDGNDQISGEDGNDTLFAGAGNDTLNGGAGNDWFVIDTVAWGQDTIADFAKGDVIDVSAIGMSDFAALTPFLRQVGKNVEFSLTWDGQNEKMTILNFNVGDLSATDFVFNSSKLARNFWGTNSSDVMFGSGGADTLRGEDGDDYIVSGFGAGTITGDAGNDIVESSHGSNNIRGGGGFDVVRYNFAASGAAKHNADGSWTVAKPGGAIDVLTEIEAVAFSDANIAIRQPNHADINSDSHSDIVLQDAGNGAVYAWQMSGLSLLGGGYVGWTPGPQWQVAGVGDFNADSNGDILLQNTSDGSCYRWELNGTTLVGSGFTGWTPGPSWHVVGTGLFNDDRYSDILLQNATDGGCYLWDTKDGAVIGGGSVGWTPGAAWKAVGIGDFNGDNHSDIVLQNQVDGSCYLWELNDTGLVGHGYVGWTPGAAWKVRDTGDYNGDGHSDLLLQNQSNGACYIWELNGTALVDHGFVGWTPGADWVAQKGGDFNDDGYADILLQNSSTGADYVWEMTGKALAGHGFVGWAPGSNWHSVG